MTPETKTSSPMFTPASSDATAFCDYIRSHCYIPQWAKNALEGGDEAAYKFAVNMLNSGDRVTLLQATKLFRDAGFFIEPVHASEKAKLSQWGLGK